MEGKEKKIKKFKLFKWIIIELIVLICLFLLYQLYIGWEITKDEKNLDKGNISIPKDEVDGSDELSPEEEVALEEQELLRKQKQDRKDLIAKADRLILSYDYDGAIELIKAYEGPEGGYETYSSLISAIERYEAERSTLVLYGGSYTSVTQFNHIFFHTLVADNSKAFDGDYDETGYNMYMTTTNEFERIIQKMYEDGYVLVGLHDIAEQVTLEDGSTEFVEKEIYLPQGKKPFVLSQDDVSYYEYMTGDGFASKIVIGDDGKPTTEMVLDDGSTVRGSFDIVPILDAFVDEHPDFSYKGAKGIIALTGYEGVLGYRTNDPASSTYEKDRESVKTIAKTLRADGWEFASHGWGHKNSLTISYDNFVRDTNRWLEEVASLIGPTDIYIFPFGIDFETTIGTYSSNKYYYLKEKGFNYFCGVFKEPWMHLKKDYVRMTRRPLDGQAMIQFPERLSDLFDAGEVLDSDRPKQSW